MSEPKVTECWAIESDDGSPTTDFIFAKKDAQQRDAAAVLIWREDYDAMRKELEETKQRADANHMIADTCTLSARELADKMTAMETELEETKKALDNALIQLGLMDGDIRLLKESRNEQR